MKRWGARGLVRVSLNPDCQVQAAMVTLEMPEDAFYATYVGSPYPGERGERTAALRWGNQFDAHLAEQNATALLASLDGQFGLSPATAIVRDLGQEVPGEKPTAIAERRRRTVRVIADVLAGSPSCDVLIQPPLRLRIGPRRFISVVPDALVLDRRRGVYVPLEAKAYIAVDGMSEPGDRDDLRRQAAVQVHALRAEFAQFRASDRVTPQAFLVLATPFGLRPQAAVLEDLNGEYAAIERAIRTLSDTFNRLQPLQTSMSIQQALHHLPNHYQEGCLTSCPMNGVCRLNAPGLVGQLGDSAGRYVDVSLDLNRILALLSGAQPLSPEESKLLTSLRATATRFQWSWE